MHTDHFLYFGPPWEAGIQRRKPSRVREHPLRTPSLAGWGRSLALHPASGAPPGPRSDATGWIMAPISVTASLFPILCESHVFFATRVTKVISREDLGLPCVTSCHPHSLLVWDPPLL